MKHLACGIGLPALLAAGLVGCSYGDISVPNQQDPNATFQLGQVVGGATKQLEVDPSQVGKFLPQPELLTPGGAGRADLVYLDPNANFASYRNVLIDPVTIWAGPNSDLNSVPADQKRALANAAYSDIYNALKGHCHMVQKAGANTLHLRFALVDTKIPNAALDTVATYAPYASTAYSLASVAFNNGVGYFSGTATGEGYATDASSGKLLWEAVDKRGGTTAVVANTFDNWRDVRHVFEAWGVQLRERLQELRICRKQVKA